MSYLPFASLAYFLNAVSVTTDKFLLKKFIPDPLTYVFYINLYSLLVLLLAPLTHLPSLTVFLLASLSTALWSLGAFFMFKALKVGLVSRVIPVIGTLTPIILLVHASFFATISLNQTWAAGFLISGLFFLTLVDLKGTFQIKELFLEILASLAFGASYLLLREAYLKADFLTVLVTSRYLLLPCILAVFLVPVSRKKITKPGGLNINFKSKLGVLFTLGQISGGASQMLLTFSISLTTPALVNSLAGIQYIFLLIFSLPLSKKFPKVFEEKSGRLSFLSKAAGVMAVFAGLYILSFPAKAPAITFGVTYSPLYAVELGLNPHSTFAGMLDDLQIKQVRLPVYWSEVEKFPRQFNFASLDYYLNEAQKRNVKVILVVGLKQPRWPECFAPQWVSQSASGQKQARVLDLVQREVNYFKNFKSIAAWQVENEPFFYYGACDKVTPQTRDLLKKEVEIIKNADKRPVLVTDSGELSTWIEAVSLSDIFGHTLYREVWNPVLGSRQYPLPPIFYTLKGQLAKLLVSNNPKIIVSELQAEPWLPKGKHTSHVNPNTGAEIFPVGKLSQNVEYAKETGASDILLWGVEWWYYMAKAGHPEYLEYAKTLF